MSRQCARPGCSQPAVATLTYHYRDQAAWLERLASEAHPMTHDLCDTHAERMSVPQGWHLEDRRAVTTLAPHGIEVGTEAGDELDHEHVPASTLSTGLFHSQLAS